MERLKFLQTVKNTNTNIQTERERDNYETQELANQTRDHKRYGKKTNKFIFQSK